MDPRPAITERRLAGVRRILVVTGGKGGIGKSSVAAGLALSMARAGHRVGLLDLDLSCPSAHVILGIGESTPEEDRGLVPLVAHGITFLSMASFTGERAAPIRGSETSDALLEMLAVTRWGNLDVLLVDSPPGLGDALMDMVSLLPRAEFVVVAGPSPVVLAVVRRTLDLLRRVDAPMAGLIENMRAPADPVGAIAAALDPALPVLASVEFDTGLAASVGDAERLASSTFMRQLEPAARALVPAPPNGD